MSKRKTIEELEAAAKAAEKRARELRAAAKRATEAEEAKVNAEIIKALKEWLKTFPDGSKKNWEDLPGYFREQARRNREKLHKVEHAESVTD